MSQGNCPWEQRRRDQPEGCGLPAPSLNSQDAQLARPLATKFPAAGSAVAAPQQVMWRPGFWKAVLNTPTPPRDFPRLLHADPGFLRIMHLTAPHTSVRTWLT